MKYTKAQVNTVAKEMQRRYIEGEVEGHEIVLALLAMEKAGRITIEDIRFILLYIFYGNRQAVIRVLAKAGNMVTAELIDAIINESQNS